MTKPTQTEETVYKRRRHDSDFKARTIVPTYC
jgi:hypothetical protein